MGMTGTMRGYARAVRFKAEAMSHQVKDRMLEKRLDRTHQESERLRAENELLRDEVEASHVEHRRILDMLEDRLPDDEQRRSHAGRWLLLLLAIGSGAYALIRRNRSDRDEWAELEPGRKAAGTA